MRYMYSAFLIVYDTYQVQSPADDDTPAHFLPRLFFHVWYVENNPENDNNNANITANSDDNSCEEIDNDFEEVDLQELEEIKKMLPPLKRRNNKKRTANKRFLNKAKHKHKHKQK